MFLAWYWYWVSVLAWISIYVDFTDNRSSHHVSIGKFQFHAKGIKLSPQDKIFTARDYIYMYHGPQSAWISYITIPAASHILHVCAAENHLEQGHECT